MQQYLNAVREILEVGTRKENRTGVDTLSTFNVNYEIDLRDGFPLLTTKKVNWKNIVVEVLWFLSGNTDIGILQKHKCKFWDPWANDEGEVPSAYGNFWRHFPVHAPDPKRLDAMRLAGFNDQIAWAVESLKKSPMSRRIVVSAWAPGNAQTSKLPPCHIVFVFNVQNLPEKCTACEGKGVVLGVEACRRCRGSGAIEHQRLCLHLTQRSCDIALGVPYNIATYALLLELISRFTGIKPGIFAHTLVDAHAYTCKPDGSMADMDHVPGLREQLTRKPRPLPRLGIDEGIVDLADVHKLLDLDTEGVMDHFRLEGYNPHPAIKFKVAV
jgi:thymidylate synthase